MSTELTVDYLKKALPSRRNTITEELVDLINTANMDPEFQAESLTSTLITYEGVMTKHKASIKDYVYAVKFCAYLITEDDNYTEAYRRTFSDREFVSSKVGCKTDSADYQALTSAASRYRKNRLVTDILTLSQAPLDIMFTGYRYKAIGVLADLMMTAKYDKDRISAAKELLAATKGPENMKVTLDVGAGASTAIQDLNDQLSLMATRQQRLLEGGLSLVDVQKIGVNINAVSDVLEGEVLYER
jgi:hypothetical protein